jgi:hypothetical protein
MGNGLRGAKSDRLPGPGEYDVSAGGGKAGSMPFGRSRR